MIKISVLIPAYNESENITHLLESLKRQNLNEIRVSEILILDPGSQDDTYIKCEDFKKKNPDLNIKIFKENERTGKSNAVNFLISKNSNGICVLCGADIILDEFCLENLCLPLKNGEIGMTGAHAVSTENPKKLLGFFNAQLWLMHNEIALLAPKCGELIAFKKVFYKIPSDSPVDEASVENEILKKNLRIVYCKDAIIFNSGAKTLKEFISQRRRINFGHIWIKKKYARKVSTNNLSLLLKVIKKTTKSNPVFMLKLGILAIVEFYAKFLAYMDFYILQKKYTIWEPIKSSKKINKKR